MQSGFLGALSSFEYQFGSGGWETASGYNLSRETSASGVLAISDGHSLDCILYFFADVEVVRLLDDSRGVVEANCTAEFRDVYAGRDVLGMVTLSKTHQLSNLFRILGEKGVIVVRDGQTQSVTYLWNDSDLRMEISAADSGPESPEPEYFRLQIENLVRPIREREEPRVDGKQGLKSAALMEKCYLKAKRLDEPWCDATISRLQHGLPK